jgi:hypothetical protein
MRAASPLLH